MTTFDHGTSPERTESFSGPGAGTSEGYEQLGHYRIVREIGRGGQGTVFLATDQRLGRDVALKVLTVGAGRIPAERLKRFRREAEAASKLDHPNICPVHDAGEIEGRPFITMRYVEGETLAQRIDKARAAKQPGESSSDVTTRKGITDTVALIEKLARALHYSHERGLIPRDIKPGNVMVTADGEPVVLDFGLARDELADDQGLTHSGDLLGTPLYMSPEQLLAQRIPLDRRTDVYSLGATLYECLTLRRPFDAPTRAALYQRILTSAPLGASSLNRQIPRDLQVVIETAMDKDRDRRYQTALDFAGDLRRLLEFEPIQARPIGRRLRLRRWIQRHPAGAVGIAGLTLALILLSVLLFEQNRFLVEQRSALALTRAVALAAQSRHAAESNPVLGLLLAREAARLEPGRAETQSELQSAFAGVHERQRFEHADRVMHARFTPDESGIVTGDASGAVIRWTLDGTVARRYPGLEGSTTDLRLAPDGTLLLGSGGKQVCVWNLETGQVVAQLEHAGKINTACFSPDGQSILTACIDGKVRLMSLAGETIRELSHEAPVFLALFSPDGEQVLTAEGSGWLSHPRDRYLVSLWTLSGIEPVFQWENRQGGPRSACFSPDGRFVAVASADGTARVWDATTGASLETFEASSILLGVEFDASGESLLAASQLDGALLWDRGSRELLRAFGSGNCTVAKFAPGSRIITAGREIHVFDLEGGVLETFQGHANGIESAVTSRDGRWLLTASFDHTARLWDMQSDQSPVLYGSRSARGWKSVEYSPDGKKILFTRYGFPESWSPDTGEVTEVVGFDQPSWQATYSHDAHKVVSSAPDGYHGAELLDLLDGRHVLLPDSGRTFFASFDETGRRVVTAGDRGTVRVWSDRGQILHEIPHPKDQIVHSAMLRGDRVLTACADGVARLCSVEGEILREFKGHDDRVYRARWSPDGQLVLTSSGDNTARLWDLDGNPLEVFRHRAIVKDALFSPDGRRILTVSRDGTARVWSLDGRELFALRSPCDFSAAAFRPDGRRIVTLDEFGEARVWIADVDELVTRADEQLAPRRFRAEELEPYRALLGDRFQVLSGASAGGER